MVKAVRDRYDGRRRNPWNEMECGSNYARSMASYALLPIYSGFVFDMPRRRMGFKPLKGAGRFFWSLEGAWGTVEIGADEIRLTVLSGELTLERFVTNKAGRVRAAQLDGAPAEYTIDGEDVVFGVAQTLCEGQSLTLTLG